MADKKSTTTPPRLVSAKGASAELGIPYRTILDVAHRGELPVVRINTAVYFERRDLDNWIASRKERASGPAVTETRGDAA